MPMQPVYLVAVKNLPKFLTDIRGAQAPEKFTLRFMESLGFTSTNDRLFIPLLKALKFLDDNGKPTARYHAFLDDTQWKAVLAEGIRDAYQELFRVNRQAHKLTREQVLGKLKSLSEGQAGASVVSNSAKTFLELVKLADFSPVKADGTSAATPETPAVEVPTVQPSGRDGTEPPSLELSGSVNAGATLVYRIEIVLPSVRDQAVYDAIFRSAREHLLR